MANSRVEKYCINTDETFVPVVLLDVLLMFGRSSLPAIGMFIKWKYVGLS